MRPLSTTPSLTSCLPSARETQQNPLSRLRGADIAALATGMATVRMVVGAATVCLCIRRRHHDHPGEAAAVTAKTQPLLPRRHTPARNSGSLEPPESGENIQSSVTNLSRLAHTLQGVFLGQSAQGDIRMGVLSARVTSSV
ncbi:hypothetical protein PG993_004961 [Apiospora rasikravindrae]|uniref:Uncharacterized protein n=1 Tax=Apiospora rasikravindrae TaxID=990691 RepID=A0ABR1TEB2_9PEZI